MIKLKNGVITTPDIDFDEKCGGFGILLFQLCVENSNKVALVSQIFMKVDSTNLNFSRLIPVMMNLKPTIPCCRKVYPQPKPFKIEA